MAKAPDNRRKGRGTPWKQSQRGSVLSDELLEKRLLACLLLDPDGQIPVVMTIVSVDDFESPTRGNIFRELRALHRTRTAFDLILFAKHCEAQSICDTTTILDLHDKYVPLAANAPNFAKDLRDLSIKRKAYYLGEQLQHQACNGDTGADIVRSLREQIAGLEADLVPPEDKGFCAIACSELATTNFQLKYIVEGVLVADQPLLLGGPHKSLKTSVLLDLALSLATGESFLQRFKVLEQRRVAVMSGESGLATIRESMLRIAAAKQIDLFKVDGLVFSEQLPQFRSIESLEHWARFIRKHQPSVVAVDPAYLAVDGSDAGNLFDIGHQLREANQICSELGAQLIIVHHTRKANRGTEFEPPKLEELSWAGWREWARQWVLLGRRDEYIEGTGEHRLWLSAGGSAGHSGLYGLDISEGVGHGARYWRTTTLRMDECRSVDEGKKQAARDRRQTEKVKSDAEKLARIMAERSGPETKTVLRDLCGFNSTRINAALAHLLTNGLATQTDVFKSKQRTPKEGYKLKTDDGAA